MSGRVHIVGAGLAGLSAAVELAGAGYAATVHEAAGHAGGRCRSFYDSELERIIDNGNHLLLSGNCSALEFLRTVGAEERMTGPGRAAFPFLDLASGLRWRVEPDRGSIPWSIFSAERRVPGTTIRDYASVLKLLWCGSKATVADCLGPDSALFQRFWEPLSVSVLNTAADEAAARLLRPVLVETFGRGEAACRPLIAARGLSDSFVDPAVDYLTERGATISFGRRLRRIGCEGDRVSDLEFADAVVSLGSGDAVVLAVPSAVAADLVPGLQTPNEYRSIVNGHFLLPEPRDDISFLGLVGGTSQWVFVRRDVASITVSAADELADEPSEAVAAGLWPEVRRALDLGEAPLGRYRIVKEKRATIAQTPAQIRRRPGSKTAWANLALAGDWTDTGLPATIEGAIRSGQFAAQSVKKALSA